jgi:predicted acylesterase/phospholipase RssA
MPIRNIVFSGGGIKILAQIGAFKALADHHLTDSIESFAGVSAGSLISLGLVLGYSINELKDIMIGLDILKIIDINADNILNYLNDYGVDTGDKLLNAIEVVIKKKTSNSKITFSELYAITNKKLVIVVSNLTKSVSEYLDHIKTPDMEVSSAIRMSCCYPYYFTPIKYNGCCYIDGALLDNYPIQVFDTVAEDTVAEDTVAEDTVAEDTVAEDTVKDTVAEDTVKDTVTEDTVAEDTVTEDTVAEDTVTELPETIGILVYDLDMVNVNIDSIFIYSSQIINSLLRELVLLKYNKYKENTIMIKSDFHPLNVDITQEQKQDLFELGYNQSLNFILKK